MTSGRHIAPLVAAHRERIALIKDRAALLGLALAILDVVFFGVVYDSVSTDESGRALSLFLLAQTGLYFFVLLAIYRGISQDIIGKSRIFPLEPRERFWFLVRAFAQHPVPRWVWMANGLLMFFAFGPHPVFLLCVLVAGVMLGGVHLLSAALFLWMDRSSRPVTVLGVIVLYAGVVSTAVQLLPEAAGPLEHTFLPWYAAQSMLAFVRGEFIDGAVHGLLLVTIPALAGFVGRTYS